MEILSPVAEQKVVAAQVENRLDDINGKVIGFLDNGWRSGGIIIERLDELFRSEKNARTYRKKTETSGPDEIGLHDEVAQNCDAAVVLIAN